MKKRYSTAEMEVIRLESEDIITTSGDVLCAESISCNEYCGEADNCGEYR